MTKFRVMVVDEHQGFREAVSRLMSEQGYEAYPAADGIDALRQIYEVKPQLIVSDAGLANLSGFEFLPFVKRRFPSIGVIALEGQQNQQTKRSSAVADKLLPKQPLNPKALLGSAEELLARVRAGGDSVECD
jgi:CheY-like chemotaxis protein